MMLTRLVDREDRLFSGFTHDWVRALASRVTHLEVICQVAGSMDLPANVKVTPVRGKHRIPRLRLLLAFQRAIWPSVHGVDVVFAHFSSSHALAAAPSAKLCGVPIVQWWTGGYVNSLLRLSHMLVDRVVTASPESYRLPSKKVTVLGHGVDFERFAPDMARNAGPLDGRVVLSVGTLSPGKDVETQIDAAALLLQRPGFDDVTFMVAGEEPHWAHGYRAALEAYIAKRGLSSRFQLVGGIPYSEIVKFYQSGTVMVSTSRTGSIDKVPLEAMGCGLPTLVTGEVYSRLLAEERPILLAREGDAADLSDKLARLLTRAPAELRALGMKLRAQVMKDHTLEGLMDSLVAVFAETVEMRKLGTRWSS